MFTFLFTTKTGLVFEPMRWQENTWWPPGGFVERSDAQAAWLALSPIQQLELESSKLCLQATTGFFCLNTNPTKINLFLRDCGCAFFWHIFHALLFSIAQLKRCLITEALYIPISWQCVAGKCNGAGPYCCCKRWVDRELALALCPTRLLGDRVG